MPASEMAPTRTSIPPPRKRNWQTRRTFKVEYMTYPFNHVSPHPPRERPTPGRATAAGSVKQAAAPAARGPALDAVPAAADGPLPGPAQARLQLGPVGGWHVLEVTQHAAPAPAAQGHHHVPLFRGPRRQPLAGHDHL